MARTIELSSSVGTSTCPHQIYTRGRVFHLSGFGPLCQNNVSDDSMGDLQLDTISVLNLKPARRVIKSSFFYEPTLLVIYLLGF